MRSFFITLILLSINLLSQQSTYNQEFQVNSYTNSRQDNFNIELLNDNKFVICWDSWYQDGSDIGIYAQIFDFNGNKINSEIRVNSYTQTSQENSQILKINDDKFIICWESIAYNTGVGQDGSGCGIFAQFLNFNGDKIGNEFQVNEYIESEQTDPRLLKINENKFLICWQSYSQDGSQEGIYAKIYDSNGNTVKNEFQVNTFTTSAQDRPRVLSLSSDLFVICWNSWEEDGNGIGIFAQIFDENGEKVGSEFQVNTYSENWQQAPALLKLSDDKFIIYWISREQDGSGSGIYAQIFDLQGNKINEEFRINSYSDNDQSDPMITNLNNDQFVACWESQGQDGSGHGIFAQRFSDDGEYLGNEFHVNTATLGYQTRSFIESLSDSIFIICWEGPEADGNYSDIFAQLFDASCNKIGSEFRLNSYTENYQYNTKIKKIDSEKFIACWVSNGQDGDSDGIFGKILLSTPVYHELNDFLLIEPAYDEIIYQADPTFSWNKTSQIRINFPWELTYDLYIDNDETFSNPFLITGIEDTTYQIDSLGVGQTYYAKVLARNYYGDSLWSSNITGFYIDRNATGTEETKELPSEFKLEQNYPNPFNPTTTIEYIIPSSGFVELNVYNLLGQVIANLVNEIKPAGIHKIKFNAIEFPSGIYFYKVDFNGSHKIRKLILLK